EETKFKFEEKELKYTKIYNYISNATYKKEGETGTYKISYEYQNILSNIGDLNFTINYSDSKKISLNFDDKYNKNEGKIFEFEKYNMYLNRIETKKGDVLKYKKIYSYNRGMNSTLSVFNKCSIDYTDKDNTIISRKTNRFDLNGMIIKNLENNYRKDIEYYGMNACYYFVKNKGLIRLDTFKSDVIHDEDYIEYDNYDDIMGSQIKGFEIKSENENKRIEVKLKNLGINKTLNSTLDLGVTFEDIANKDVYGISIDRDKINFGSEVYQYNLRYVNDNRLADKNEETSYIEFIGIDGGTKRAPKKVTGTLLNLHVGIKDTFKSICEKYYDAFAFYYSLKPNLNSTEIAEVGNLFSQLLNNNQTKVKVSPEYFKLLESDDKIVYCSIVSQDEVYLYLVEKNAYSGLEKTNSLVKIDETGKETEIYSQSYTYDSYGRVSEIKDDRGNYKKYTYKIKGTEFSECINDLDKVSNVEIGNKTGKLYSTDNEYNETYALNPLRNIRLSKKIIKDKDGKEIKSELYSYYDYVNGTNNNNNKLESITSYEGKVEDNKSKNKIVFTYDTIKSDNPLKTLEIYDVNPTGEITAVKYTKTYNYQDGTGLMDSVTDAKNNTTSFLYDYIGRNSQITFADNTQVNYTFKDGEGYYTREIKSSESATEYLQKEKINYFDSKIDSVNYYLRENNEDKLKTKSYTYDGAGRRITEKDLNGNQYKYVYENDFLKEIVNPDGTKKSLSYRVVYLENESMIETVITDESGKITYNIKDVYGNERASMVNIGDNKATGKYIVYNERNLPVEIYENVIFEYTAGAYTYIPGSYKPINKTDIEVLKTVIEYDGLGRMISKTLKGMKLDNTTTLKDKKETYQYDIFNNVISKSLYKGTDEIAYFTESYEYDGAGNMFKKTENADGKNLITSVEYDLNGNLTKVTYPSGVVKIYMYDSRNRVTQEIINPTLAEDKRNVVFYEYDNMGRVVAKYDKRAAKKDQDKKYIYSDTTGYTYNSDVINDSYGIKNEYDTLGRLLKVIYPDGKVEIAEYDNNGNVTKVTNKFKGVTNYYYDKLNRKIFESAINGGDRDYTASFRVYNGNGTIALKGLSKGITDKYSVCPTDISGTISTLSQDTSKVISYKYNDKNLVESVFVPESGKTEYEYDDYMRLKSKSMKSGANEE
ncbi:MAG TPA: hypothetical protein PK771_08005, partial [Spirochaetota bacterium]|nr:hypothetical protein [Spirochaetota bacterium]